MSHIPQQAKKVFSGQIFDVYHWDQELYDGSTATFEMLSRPDSVQIIPVVDEKVLLLKESQPTKENFITLPGGRREKGEDPIDTAKRELLEETGYASDDWEFYKVWHPYTKIDWDVYVFVAKNCKKIADPTPDAGEKITPMTLSFDAFVSLVTEGNFYGKELTCEFLRMRLNPEELDVFKTFLMGET